MKKMSLEVIPLLGMLSAQAAKKNVAIEINGRRNFITKEQLQAAKRNGAVFAINSDAHTSGRVGDTLRAVKRGERRSHFNKELLDKIGRTLAAGRQVMLFQNRRGFAPYIECGECGWTAGCPRCSVTLTYHKQDNRLRCHTCGYSAPMVSACPKCSTPSPRPQGFGTEKVEEQLASLFPEARIVRLDRDTAASLLTNACWCLDNGNMLPCDPTATAVANTNKGFITRMNRLNRAKKFNFTEDSIVEYVTSVNDLHWLALYLQPLSYRSYYFDS